MTIHTAHAHKHFSPETKSKVRPKKKFAPVPQHARAAYDAMGIGMAPPHVTNLDPRGLFDVRHICDRK